MNRELKHKAVVSVIIHAALITFLILRSFIGCHRMSSRNISPFIDLQMGTGASGMKGGAAAAAAADKDDSFPQPVKKRASGTVAVSKKLVKRPVKNVLAKKQLSENEIKRMLGEGVAPGSSAVPGIGIGSGSGGGGSTHPYAYYLGLVRAAMYEAWQQPSSLIGQKGLVTAVQIRVQRDGQITRKQIITPSGNAQMDESVLRALEAISRLPELPPGFGGIYQDITIDFELTEAALPQTE